MYQIFYIGLFLQGLLEFLPVSSSMFIKILFMLSKVPINSAFINISHCFSGFVGIFYFRNEIIDIFFKKSKFIFYSFAVLGSIVGFLGVYFSLGADFVGFEHKHDSFFWLQHLISAILLHHCLTKDNEKITYYDCNILYYGIGFICGLMIWGSFILGSSRLTILLLILKTIMPLEQAFRTSVIISSGINIAAFVFILLKSPLTTGALIKKTAFFIPLFSVFSYYSLKFIHRNLKIALITSNFFRIFICGLGFVKDIDLFRKIKEITESLIPFKYLRWVYGIIGGVLSNFFFIGLSFYYSKNFSDTWYLILLIILSSLVVDIIIFFTIKYFTKYNKNFIIIENLTKYFNIHLLCKLLILIHKIIPFSRIVTIGLSANILSNRNFIFQMIINSIIWYFILLYLANKNFFNT